MLHNMGLFATPEAGRRAMDGMPRLEPGRFQAAALCPLAAAPYRPDVVVIESLPEHLMWLSLASIYQSGDRLHFDSAIFQATCVDSTVIPFLTGSVNLTSGCYGCREATNIRESESLMGIPMPRLPEIVANLQMLASSAMRRARAKAVFQAFNGRADSPEPEEQSVAERLPGGTASR